MLGSRVGRVVSAAARRGFASQIPKPGFFERAFGDPVFQNALTEEFPGVPQGTPAPLSAPVVQTSTLSNGVQVVSIDNGGAASSVGVFVKAGSRYDVVPGTSHLLETLAFSATSSRSAAKLMRDIESAGGVVTVRADREVIAYTGQGLRDNMSAIAGAVTEMVTQPVFAPWDVDAAKHKLEEIIQTVESDPRSAIPEAIHAAAYGPEAPLGRSKYATVADLEDLDSKTLKSHLQARVTGANIVFAGANLSHEYLKELADLYLGNVAAGVASHDARAAQREAATFVGGQSLIRTSHGHAAHVAVAFPTAGLFEKSIHAAGVLQALLGSSSVGSHSRIARSLHNDAHSFIRSMSSFVFPYHDTGLVGIVASTADHEAHRLVDVMAGFLDDAASMAIPSGELDRAKRLYKLKIAQQYECRNGLLAEVASQAMYGNNGSNVSVAVGDVLKAIDAVTAADVKAVAQNALKSPPALAFAGSLRNVPRYDVAASYFKVK